MRPKPHEIQPDLERRRRLVTEFRSATPVHHQVPDDFDEALNEIPDVLDGAMRTLARVSRSGNSAHDLIRSFGLLDSYVAKWTRLQPRPLRNKARTLGRSLVQLRAGLDDAVEALRAPTMHEAQRLEGTGQALTAAAEESWSVLREILEYEELGALPPAEYFNSLGARAREATGSSSLEDLDRHLKVLYGREPAGDTSGLGLQLHMLRVVIITLLDSESCMAVAHTTEKLLSDGGWTSAVLASDAWHKEHGRVTALLSASLFALRNLDRATDLEAVKYSLDLVVTCRDGIIRHALATLRASAVQDYTKLVRKSAGSLIKTCSEAYPALKLNENLSPTLRNAGAHSDYDYDADSCRVVVGLGGAAQVMLTEDEFINDVLAYLEQGVALLLGLTGALDRAGVEASISPYLSERDRMAAIEVMVGAMGVETSGLDLTPEGLTFVGKGDVATFMTIAAGVTAIVADDVSQMVGTYRGNDEKAVECRAELDAYRRFQARTAVSIQDTIMNCAEVVSATSIGGASPWSLDEWSGAGLKLIERLPTDTLGSIVRRIRAFQKLALAGGAEEVASTCGLILTELRRGLAPLYGAPAPPALAGMPPRTRPILPHDTQ